MIMVDLGDLDPAGGQTSRAPGAAIPTSERVRNGRGQWITTTDQVMIDAEAARLRSRSLSYAQIAAEMGCGEETARERVGRALASITREPAADLITMELAKLDRLERSVIKVLESFHYVVNEGRIIKRRDPASRKMVELEDDAPVLAAAKVLKDLSESRRKLLGLDSSTKVNVSGGVVYRFENVSDEDL